jgi:hypothetical protein
MGNGVTAPTRAQVDHLLVNTSEGALLNVTRDPRVSSRLLRLLLAGDGTHSLVRAAALRHARTPVDSLVRAALSNESGVCVVAAENPSLPHEVILALARGERTDANPYSRIGALRNSSLPKDEHCAVLLTLPETQDHPGYAALARNPNLSSEAASALAESSSMWVRAEIAQRHLWLLPAELIGALTQDANSHVQHRLSLGLPDYFEQRLGVSVANVQAREMLTGQQWWTLTPESPEVTLALMMHHNALDQGRLSETAN